ncbi:uncharacterized protein METZ01_LOCUS151496 [marine metagenome]|uniref:J domain-containing protein n=1 Tax=marine metagenome TaxID=408172 RepID=A0A382AC21_9ZZZZ
MIRKKITAQRDFENLQLKPGASIDSIKNSYKTLVKIWHPDLFPSNQPKAQEKAHKMFRLISESYRRLVKYHEDCSKNNYSRVYQEPSLYEYPQESTNFGNDEVSPTQTVEMVDQKWPDGTKYEGMILDGKFHGRGIYTYPNGDVYVGEFRFGKMQGEGQFSFTNGDKYVGSVSENAMHGKGKMTFVKGGHYMGYFSKNQFHGEGVLATPGKVLAGNWDNGIFVD